MHSADRAQYEVLKEDELDSQEETAHDPFLPNLKLDETHNLDVFFSQIYEYHQSGGFCVILTQYLFTAFKFAFLFFCIIELMVCVKWDRLIDPSVAVRNWSDVTAPPGVCWARLPPLAAICFATAIIVFTVNLVRSALSLVQIWGVRRFCSITLDMPKGDAELADITWSEILRRLLSVQHQMRFSPSNIKLDELGVYNRILRRKNYLIGMINRSVIPFQFKAPQFVSQSGWYVYLPDLYLHSLYWLLFWGPKCPFITYWQLRPEYKWLTKRHELANEFATQSRFLGVLGLCFSPFVLLVQLLLFLCSNAERLRYEPGSLFGRRWSNYAWYYLRHFNELRHEFLVRLKLAHLPATQYLDCFPSRLLNVIAENIAFTAGGLSLMLFIASLFREGLIHLSGYLAVMAIGGLLAKICSSILPDDQAAHFPRAKLIETLARIHYVPDHWKEQAHTHLVRHEFSQLFQLRIVGGLEEILSPLLTPLILLFYLPKHSLEIVDFLRNFTVEIPGVGDTCSFAQLSIQRHGNPDWSPHFDEDDDDSDERNDDTNVTSPARQHTDWSDRPRRASHDVFDVPSTIPQVIPSTLLSADLDVIHTNQAAADGKIELSLMHFHFTNPGWSLPPDGRAYLSAVRKQALTDIQRHKQEQFEFITGTRNSLAHDRNSSGSHHHPLSAVASPPVNSIYRSLFTAGPSPRQSARFPDDGQVYSSDFLAHVKNISHLPGSGFSASDTFGIGSALAESVIMNRPTKSATPEEPAPSPVSSRINKGSKPLVASKSTDTRLFEGRTSTGASRMTSSTISQAFMSPQIFPPFGGITPSGSLMATSGLYNPQLLLHTPYQPYTSQMEDKAYLSANLLSPSIGTSLMLHHAAVAASGNAASDLTTDMDASSLYLHELYQRRKQQQRFSQSNTGSFRSQVPPPIPVQQIRTRYGNREGPADQLRETVTSVGAEVRYQQPIAACPSTPSSVGALGSHYIGPVGRARGLFSSSGVLVGFRPGVESRRPFKVTEEEEEALIMTTDEEDQHSAPPFVATPSSDVFPPPAPNPPPGPPLSFSIPGAGDEVSIWPDLPPPTC